MSKAMDQFRQIVDDSKWLTPGALPSKIEDRFIWSATYRDTGTEVQEDANGLGSFTLLDPTRISRVSLLDRTTIKNGAGLSIDQEVPQGAIAVFVRRRMAHLLDGMVGLPHFTIIGYKWPDGDPRPAQYTFFKEDTDDYFTSNDFNAV